MNRKLIRALAGEFAGTFTIVFFAAGGIHLLNFSSHAIGNTEAALLIGFIITLLVLAFGKTLGAHFNPAVTIGLYLAGIFNKKTIPVYIFSQISGALLASLLIWILSPAHINSGATVPNVSSFQTIIIEIILAFLLLLVILLSTQISNKIIPYAGIFIGGIICIGILFAGELTGASMNPARTLGPDIVRTNFSTTWIYIVSSFAGTTLCGVTWLRVKNYSQRKKQFLQRF